MQEIELAYLTHPFWIWLAVAAIFLALEVPTASGYLLWPAGASGIVALISLVRPIAPPFDVITVAGLTIVLTIVGRRFFPRKSQDQGLDISDRRGRLKGRVGKTVSAFEAGQGRVFVDGAEWSAELAPGQAPPEPGARVEVVEVQGGGRLVVRVA
ncbi:MAG TPA: NfeD family protein [Caulobacteraceae bacterium]|nr:NfeD family protein [Caulobacteraceae bacterium]